MKIIESYALTKREQTKFPRKKKNRRWQKKYTKKYSVQVPRTDFVVSETRGLVICHPFMASTLRKELANQPVHADTQSYGGLGFAQYF